MEKEQEIADQEAVTDAPETSVEQAAPEDMPEGGVEKQPDDREDLILKLEDARSKADEHWDQLIRARAEMDNLRKRHSRELENAHKFALERFVGALLPVLDSMEMGLSAASEEARTSWRCEGIWLTARVTCSTPPR